MVLLLNIYTLISCLNKHCFLLHYFVINYSGFSYAIFYICLNTLLILYPDCSLAVDDPCFKSCKEINVGASAVKNNSSSSQAK